VPGYRYHVRLSQSWDTSSEYDGTFHVNKRQSSLKPKLNPLSQQNSIIMYRGGKAAMHYALTRPSSKLNKLVVVDIAPSNHNVTSLFSGYIKSMKRCEELQVKTTKEADAILKENIDVTIYNLNFHLYQT
jgi:hypothetical protein